jgi:hypothetical protein
MKKNIDDNNYAIQIDELRKKMVWTKKDLYEILLENYKEDKEKPDSLDGYRKQIYVDGSTKYLKVYFDYLYNLDDVKKQMINKPKDKLYLNIIFVLMIIILVGINFYFFKDNTFEQLKQTQTIKYKQCMKKCLKI